MPARRRRDRVPSKRSSPEDLNLVSFKLPIGGEKAHIFELGLRNQEAVEGIFVVQR